MKLNILTEKFDWILHRAARELTSMEGFEVTINGEEGKAEIDYYLPYLLFKQKKSNIQVGFFTHLEERTGISRNIDRKIEKFHKYQSKLDYCIAISKQTQGKIKKNAPIIKLGSQFSKEIIFGVCGKVHESGRKNEHFIKKLSDEGFKIIAWGHGWECEKCSDLFSFYKTIDYLIVPSSVEGGPVPVIEAISLGVPVIAPDVGWCWDYPVIKYEKNNYESLRNVLRGLTSAPTWDLWRSEHSKFFKDILWRT